MKIYKHGHPDWHHKLDSLFVAGAFIVSGSLLLARNLGYVSPYLFSLIISWPVLVIAIGVLQLIKSHITAGLILIATGSYFLLPRINELDTEWLSLFWPVILIVGGVWLFFRMWGHKHTNDHGRKKEDYTSSSYSATNGFVESEVTFGGAEHIVLDPVFTGAHVRNTFASTLLDLRHTQLQQEKTYMDIECTFGGVELYIPSEWKVSVLIDTTLAGYTDKRHSGKNQEEENAGNNKKELIIRGKLVFSGLEIKD